MNDRPPGPRVLVMVVLLVLVVRLLAWTASADSISLQPALNQTVPTRTPTSPPQTPGPSPTRPADSTPGGRTRTPGPTEEAPLLTPGQTPSATFGPGSPELTEAVPPTTAEATALTASPPATAATALAPDIGTPGPPDEPLPALATAVLLPAATGPVATALPAVSAEAAVGGASCLWPIIGLLLVAAGVVLLLRMSSNRREREGH